jgi:hexosaminidase
VRKTHLGIPILLSLLLTACGGSEPTPQAARVAVIPAPRTVVDTGDTFRLVPATRFDAAPELLDVAESQIGALRRATGLPLTHDAAGARLRVSLTPDLPPEGYRLHVAADGIGIEAADAAGAFYGFQTLRQLLPAEVESAGPAAEVEWVLPTVTIEDWPRFPYRGLHLDVGRHFFDVAFVKRYIDTMARFKLNRFHWHLTEDQGWRIEIDAYPELTTTGAWRNESTLDKNIEPYVGDGVPHGGFYTKDEIREVVAYAAERFVTVIPEIELPGHATAAIASYPELGCTEERLEVSTNWGIHDTIYCPNEVTFEFLQNVLDEVVELFPSEYIHIGGDEVPKRQWEESAAAQAVMQREGLASEEELQSWFIRRIESHLRSRGRRLIGWDEILEGGLAPDATVMSWRGTEGGIAAARQGHDVIMTPTEYAYFDFYQGDPETEPLAMNWAGHGITLDKVYAFEPVPEVLTAEQARHILGAQGNVWTEYMKTPEYVEYMAYPRALALAEVVWTPAETREYGDFLQRLRAVLRHLDALGINYRQPEELDAGGQ